MSDKTCGCCGASAVGIAKYCPDCGTAFRDQSELGPAASTALSAGGLRVGDARVTVIDCHGGALDPRSIQHLLPDDPVVRDALNRALRFTPQALSSHESLASSFMSIGGAGAPVPTVSTESMSRYSVLCGAFGVAAIFLAGVLWLSGLGDEWQRQFDWLIAPEIGLAVVGAMLLAGARATFAGATVTIRRFVERP